MQISMVLVVYREYTHEHYNQGKCKGFQFFKPSNENEIKLAFEGKIELGDSQRQDFIDNSLDINENHLHHHNHRRRIGNHNFGIPEYIRRYNCLKTSFIFFLYLIIGHLFYSLISRPNVYKRNCVSRIIVYISYLFLEVAYFF